MSKKIMKRSLALGALMAFAITGSVFAEQKVLTQNTATGSIGKGYADVNLNGWELSVAGTSTWAINSAPVSLNIVDKSTDKNGSLIVTNTTGSARGICINYGGKIDVGTLNVNVGGNAIVMDFDSPSSSVMNILAKTVTLTHTGNDTNAIQVYEGTLNIGAADNKVETFTINGNNKNIGRAIRQTTSGKVNIYAEELNIDGYNEAIKVDGSGTLNLNADKGEIKSNIEAGSSSKGTINMNLGSGVTYEGKITTKATDSSSNLTLKGATWNVTGESNVTNITGNGTVKLDMVTDSKVATVKITGDSSGVATVGATGKVTDYLASLSGETQKEAMKTVAGSVTDANGAVSDTVITDESLVTGAYTIKVVDGEVAYDEAVNTKSDAVSDAGMALKGHWRAHMNDMNKRMGELRNANGEAGVWTRMVRGESEYQGAKMQYNQYQLGYDEKLSVDKRWVVGAAVTFSEGDASYGQGSTEDKSTAFAIYGSKLNDDGTFVDLIARYAHLESDLDDANYGTGDYGTNGMSVSAEFGKRIQQGKGLWIEPQFELTYGNVDAASVSFSNGYKANYDSIDSFIARAGFALGKDIKQGNVYARASYLYDFDGETATQFEGGKAISEDFGGGWWEVGVGANINLSKATYIYADVEKTFGGEVDTNWKWNLGVRYSF